MAGTPTQRVSVTMAAILPVSTGPLTKNAVRVHSRRMNDLRVRVWRLVLLALTIVVFMMIVSLVMSIARVDTGPAERMVLGATVGGLLILGRTIRRTRSQLVS